MVKYRLTLETGVIKSSTGQEFAVYRIHLRDSKFGHMWYLSLDKQEVDDLMAKFETYTREEIIEKMSELSNSEA